MSQSLARASEWIYHGVWRVLVPWFRVPADPPQLPVLMAESIQTFRPADGFLSYLKFQFWILLGIIDIGLLIGWLVVALVAPLVAVVITPLALAVIVIPDIVAYVAIHLRYDSTWYVISDRSLRIRRGIWVIRETTITFENIQNVTVNQGPLQRYFGIADVLVQTAGGGGVNQGAEGVTLLSSHHGLIEGTDRAPEIRDLILHRLNRSQSAGLGDEVQWEHPVGQAFSSREQRDLLREIRDFARAAANSRRSKRVE